MGGGCDRGGGIKPTMVYGLESLDLAAKRGLAVPNIPVHTHPHPLQALHPSLASLVFAPPAK